MTATSDQPPLPSVAPPARQNVPMLRYGIVCFIGTSVTLVVVMFGDILLDIKIGRLAVLLAIVAGIHLAAWQFTRTYLRDMSPQELKRFLMACFVVFWLVDESAPLIAYIRDEEELTGRNIANVIAATLIDLGLVAAIIYWTIPLAVRRYVRRLSPNKPLDHSRAR